MARPATAVLMVGPRAGLLLALALLGAVRAQERRPAFVHVVDAAGAPVKAAKVTCFARPAFDEVDGVDDVVEVVADERGRAIPRLLRQRGYSAFAFAAATDGAFAISEIGEGLVADGPLELRLAAPRAPQAVQVRGLDAWAGRGAFAVCVAPAARHALTLPVFAGSAPPMPSLGCVQVVDARGGVLWAATFGHSAWQSARYEPVALTVPPPRPLGLRVTDTAGAPVVGAELWQGVHCGPLGGLQVAKGVAPVVRWRAIGRTDADGRATVELALAVAEGRVQTDLLVEARAPGFAVGTAGIVANGNPHSGGKEIVVPNDHVLPITLAPETELLVGPARAYDLVVFGDLPNEPRPISAPERAIRLRTDDAGRVRMPLPREARVTRFAKIETAGEPPVWAIVEPAGERLYVHAEARRVRVHVRDAADQPARGATLLLLDIRQLGHRTLELGMPLDAAADATVAFGRGEWALWASDGERAAWQVLDADAPAEIPLVLQPIPRATLRLVDAAGRPCAGRTIACSGSFGWKSSNPSPENRLLILRHVVSQRMLEPHTTDADGRVQFQMLPLPGAKWGLTFHEVERDSGMHSCELEPGETAEVVLPEAPPRARR